jgi:hypothetical protein
LTSQAYNLTVRIGNICLVHKKDVIVDMRQFQDNRQQFPPEELAKYAGTYVAWSPDGKHILASDDNELHLANAIRARGFNSADVLISFVAADDEVILGGGVEIDG